MAEFVKVTNQQLIAFSKDHLFYEFEMLYGVSKQLQRISQKSIKNIYIYNALLESFVIHASVILDFFYKMPINPDEAKATHYINDVDSWKKQLPPYSKHFIKFNKKRNRDVMHLNYSRLDVPVYDKNWNSLQLVRDIKRIINLFLDYADPQRVHPDIYKLRNKSEAL